jgi:hypothetical protein
MSAAPGSEAKGGFLKRHRRALLAVLGVVAVIGFVHFALPEIVGLGPTLRGWRGATRGGSRSACSSRRSRSPVRSSSSGGCSRGRVAGSGWRASYEITLAGAAATKLFATAGAGGVTLTVWALRSAGLGADQVATGMVSYEILNYAVYMAALAIVGLGLWLGVFSGHAGGIGGVEGGMIGAFLVFGVSGSLAVLAVLAYRTISYWLPTLPGAVAYVRLRRTVAGWRSQAPRGERRLPRSLPGSQPPTVNSGDANKASPT